MGWWLKSRDIAEAIQITIERCHPAPLVCRQGGQKGVSAHRIGQTRLVTAYRLIARNTVEEKIFALQNR